MHNDFLPDFHHQSERLQWHFLTIQHNSVVFGQQRPVRTTKMELDSNNEKQSTGPDVSILKVDNENK